MATLAPHQPAELAPAHWTEGTPSDEALAHIPGEAGWPIVGNTFTRVRSSSSSPTAIVSKHEASSGKLSDAAARSGPKTAARMCVPAAPPRAAMLAVRLWQAWRSPT